MKNIQANKFLHEMQNFMTTHKENILNISKQQALTAFASVFKDQNRNMFLS